jgi:hypothetical protein|uniref:Uncharacterized protein n=1 Tax=Myoviridae sp. ctx322 TaxID=2826711 RepID=A0A8S5NB91_9CAUD|nr:MAG TPA: hypothetical protein [Myoviridae sp. ctx322]
MKNLNIKYLTTDSHMNLMYREGRTYYVQIRLGKVITELQTGFAIQEHLLLKEIYSLYSKHQDFFDMGDFGYRMLVMKSCMKALSLSNLESVFNVHTMEILRKLFLFRVTPFSRTFVPKWYLSDKDWDILESSKKKYDEALNQGIAYGIFDSILEILRDYLREDSTSEVERLLSDWVQKMISIFFWGAGPVNFNSYRFEDSKECWELMSKLVIMFMNSNEEDRIKGRNIFTRTVNQVTED